MKHCFATLIVLCFIAISTAWAQEPKRINIVNKGAFNVKVSCTYTTGGYSKSKNTGQLTAGMSVNWDLESDATNITLNATCVLCSGCGTLSLEPCDGPFDNGSSRILAGNKGGTYTFSGTIFSNTAAWTAIDGSTGNSGADRTTMDILEPNGDSKLQLAVRNSEKQRAIALLDAGTTLINHPNNMGVTPLMEAVAAKNTDMASLLLSRGADMHATDSRGDNAFFKAVNMQDAAMCSKFISSGYPVSQDGKSQEKAIMLNDMNMVTLFLQNGADPNFIVSTAINRNYMDPVLIAYDKYNANPSIEVYKKLVDKRQVDMAEMLINKGASANEALAYALEKNMDVKLFSAALRRGADPTQALNKALAANKGPEYITEAVQAGADPNASLEYVIQTKNSQALNALLSSNADPNKALGIAVVNQNQQFVTQLLNSGASPNDQDVANAAKQGNEGILKALIQKGGNANAGLAPAMSAGQYKCAEALILAGAQPSGIVRVAVENNQRSLLVAALDNGDDPQPGLALAIQNDYTDMASLLFKKGAQTQDVNLVNTVISKNNLTMLKLMMDNKTNPDLGMPVAIQANNTQMVKLMIDNRADVSNPAYMEQAAKNKNLPMATMLLANGASANAGMPHAIANNDTEMVRLLISAKADATPGNYLDAACKAKNIQIATMLLGAGADPNNGMNAAVESDLTEMVRLLVDKGANASGGKYIAISAGKGNAEISRMLLAKGADAQSGMLPAIKAGSVAITDMLIKAKADASRSDLIIASVPHNNTQLTGMLIKNGADAKQALGPCIDQGKENILALLIENGVVVTDERYLLTAVAKDYAGIVDRLINAGADPMRVDAANNNYLHLAAQTASLPVVNIFLAKKVDVNLVNSTGDSPLLLAVKRDNSQAPMVKALLAAGATLNGIANAEGYPPIHLAAKLWDKRKNNNVDILRALMDAGADVKVEDKAGKKPKEYVPILTDAKKILKG